MPRQALLGVGGPLGGAAYIVDIDLETGDTSQFDSMVSDDATVEAGAALNSTDYGLQVVIDDTTATYGVKAFTASTTGICRARIYLDPNTLTMGSNHTFSVLDFSNGTALFADLQLNYNGGYDVMGRIWNDAAGQSTTTRIYFTDAPHYIEVMVTRASSDVASDGRIDVWVDGAGQQSVTGVDNYDRFNQFSKINWGATSGVDSGTSGTFFTDELLVNTTGEEIGA
jgi:hypothetical protein